MGWYNLEHVTSSWEQLHAIVCTLNVFVWKVLKKGELECIFTIIFNQYHTSRSTVFANIGIGPVSQVFTAMGIFV